ncbi:hypothetical protein E2562_009801 [Oryza meyeriana var. granulata]|uniref:Uncharacterized protein n=1 Tax=Oryza meyeriana var. granulata TaxID=110450 RepID=A0A6G1ECF4_9ORYZ|nr:hypothetical protein E2562_009801 [Oryza meyeriana var. granulata]
MCDGRGPKPGGGPSPEQPVYLIRQPKRPKKRRGIIGGPFAELRKQKPKGCRLVGSEDCGGAAG